MPLPHFNRVTPKVPNSQFISPFNEVDEWLGWINISDVINGQSSKWLSVDIDLSAYADSEVDKGMYGYTASGQPLWLLSTDIIPSSSMEKGKAYTIKLSEPTANEGANFTTRPSGSGITMWG